MSGTGRLGPHERRAARADPVLAGVEDGLMLALRRAQAAPSPLRAAIVAASAAFALVIDWATGSRTSAMLEYAVAASLGAWLCGLWRAGAILVTALLVSTVTLHTDGDEPAWQVWTNSALGFATLVLVMVVVAALRRHIDRAEFMAHVDPLTGCWSRGALLDALDHAVHGAHRTGAPLSVLYLDLDRLKRVNDTEGHAAGDAVIARFATVVMRHARRSDVLGRVGGDEFLVICPASDLAAARRFAQRLVADPELPDVSIGITELRDGQTASQLLAEADAEMYRAKGR